MYDASGSIYPCDSCIMHDSCVMHFVSRPLLSRMSGSATDCYCFTGVVVSSNCQRVSLLLKRQNLDVIHLVGLNERC